MDGRSTGVSLAEQWPPWDTVLDAWDAGDDQRADEIIEHGLRSEGAGRAVKIMAALREVRYGVDSANACQQERLDDFLHQALNGAAEDTALLQLAAAYVRLEADDWAGATNHLKAFLSVSQQVEHLPTLARGLRLVGLVAVRHENWDVAKELFLRAQGTDPASPDHQLILDMFHDGLAAGCDSTTLSTRLFEAV